MLSNLRALLSRMRNFFGDSSLDRELESEMGHSPSIRRRRQFEARMVATGAERQAHLSFGGPQQSKEAHRDSRGLPFLESLLQEPSFRFAAFP